MKKLISFLIMLSLLISFVSCAGDNGGDTGSKAASEAGQSDVSAAEESSAEVSEEPSKSEFVESEKVAEINAFLGSAPDRTLKAKNLFEGMKYTYSTAPQSDYPDNDNKILTDGVIRGIYDSKGSWAGFKNTGFLNVTFDLGEGEHALADVCVFCLQKMGYGISFPGKVKLDVSNDGENYTTIGTIQPPADAGESCSYNFHFAFPGVITARYIRVVFNYSSSLFIGEIMGLEYCEDGTHDISKGEYERNDQIYDFYEYSLAADVTVPVSAGDADYKTEQNLAVLEGTAITAQSFDPLTPAYAKLNSPKEDLRKLINGKKAASAHYSDPEMVVFLRGCGRSVYIDLGNVMGVDRLGGEFLTYTSAGVRVPENVEISLSTDGKTWVTVSDGKTGMYMNNGSKLYELDVRLEAKMKARYVRFNFITQYNYQSPAVEVNCSELEVWGTKDVSDAVDAYSPDTLVGGRYPDTEELGISALLWSCSGYFKDGRAFTYDNSLGYFAYLDEEGNIVDRLFDSVVIGGLFALRTPTDAKKDAISLIEDFVGEGRNITAIDQISETLLNKFNDGKKIKIFINLMIPNYEYKCSDIDGDGVAEDFKKRADCEKYLKWEIDYYIDMFNKQGYKNVELAGFYWNNEAIYKDYYTMQVNLITTTNEYIHSLGYMSIWAPYFGAYGLWAWKDVGFDFACLQPNYMFNATESTRLSATSKIAHILGTGIELEIEEYNNEESIKMYREYLREGYDSGTMYSVNALYQGSIPGALMSARKSTGITRTLYDDTYKFIAHKLDDDYNKPDTADMSDITDFKGTVVHGKTVIIETPDYSGYSIRILEGPVFGSYKHNYDGNLRYTAMKGYVGDVRLICELSDNAGNTKQMTYTITITE